MWTDHGFEKQPGRHIRSCIPLKLRDTELNEKLPNCNQRVAGRKKVEGVQICVLDKNGACLADIASGTLGGLEKAFPMQNNALVLGFSCTKAIAATMAHVMVEEGLS
jgi:CubicO group peptidase (beta-lactamase class C family)